MLNKDEIKDYLNRDYLQNCNLISLLDYDKDLTVLYAERDGVAFCCEGDMLYLSTDNKDAARKAIAGAGKMGVACVNSAHDRDAVVEKFRFKRSIECYQLLYDTSYERPVKNDIEIKPLTKEHISFVAKHYSRRTGYQDAKYHIEKIGMYGAFINGKIVGFIGRHSERSIGMLEVLPEFRKAGIGTSLIHFMLNRCRENNEIAFSHIISNNETSLRLNKKLDCKIAGQFIYWCY